MTPGGVFQKAFCDQGLYIAMDTATGLDAYAGGNFLKFGGIAMLSHIMANKCHCFALAVSDHNVLQTFSIEQE